MKLTELLIKQKVAIQLQWGEQKIEFTSEVIAKDDDAVYVTPYLHNGSELELNVTPYKGVICSLFADSTSGKQRVSWKNVEMKTVNRNNRILYCIKTYGFNAMARPDDRRLHERVIVNVNGQVFDELKDIGVGIIVRDISDIGISFYAPESYVPQSQQLVVTFSDSIGDKMFDVKVDCSITRMHNEEGHIVVGCKIVGENKDYKLYGFLKRLKSKSVNKINTLVNADEPSEETIIEENPEE